MSLATYNRTTRQLEKRCSKCHQVFPATPDYFTRSRHVADGLYHQCKACKARAAAQWRAKNPDYNKQWKAGNPERVKVLNASYRERNRIKLRHKSRIYRVVKHEQVRQRLAQSYHAAPDKFKTRAKEWATANQERVKRNKRAYYQQTKDISREMREAAGRLYRRDVMLPDGTLAKVLGRDGELWIVRLFDPIKVGFKQYQRIIRVRTICEVQP